MQLSSNAKRTNTYIFEFSPPHFIELRQYTNFNHIKRKSLKQGTLLLMSFLSAPKLMMLFNQIGLQKSSLFFRFLIVTAKNLQSIILQHSLRGFERQFEGQLRCNFFFIRIALSRKIPCWLFIIRVRHRIFTIPVVVYVL